MTGFFKRGNELEAELRAARSRPSDELVRRIEGRIRSGRPALARRGSFRVALPVALTAAMVGALAAVGGVSYAATSVEHAVTAVSHALVPQKANRPVVIEGLSSGGDQYQPGFGFGDPNHNHTGPPGLHREGGEFAPPLTAVLRGPTRYVTTSFTIDEQAHLWFSVIDRSTGEEFLITQKKSNADGKLHGVQAKNINYLVLVPRTIPLKLAIPANLLLPGHKYAIRIIARDPDFNKTRTLIPFGT